MLRVEWRLERSDWLNGFCDFNPSQSINVLMDLLSYKHGVSIIIDEVTYELKESIDDWPFETKLIEFKTFEGEEVGLTVHAHLFEPLKAKK